MDEFGVALTVGFGDTEHRPSSDASRVEHVDVGLECLLEWLDLADERIDRVGELVQFHCPMWLRTESWRLYSRSVVFGVQPGL